MESKISSLSPIEFLKDFNRMSDEFDQTQSKFRSTSESTLTRFKKFPISNYYNQMEGLDIETKEKEVQEVVRNKFNKVDQQFREKHNTFMRTTLDKIINNNLRHMQILEKSKAFYKMRGKSSQRSIGRGVSIKSEGKIKKKGEGKVEEVEQIYPDINFKQVDRKRVKSAYIISFNPGKKKKEVEALDNYRFCKEGGGMSRRIYSSAVLSRNPSQPRIKQQQDLRLSQSISQTLPIKPTQPISKSNPSSIRNNLTQRTTTQNLSKSNNSPTKPPTMNVQTLLDTDQYIKTRFNQTFKTIQYDYSSKVKAKSDNFLREIVYHYAND